VRWGRFATLSGPRFGIVDGETIVEMRGSPFARPAQTGRTHDLAQVSLLPPTAPRAMYSANGNYADHNAWVSRYGVPDLIDEIDFGHRALGALSADGAEIEIPPDAPGPLESEGELLAVVGRTARRVAEADAHEYIFGYTLGNDFGDRGWQRGDRTNWRWKNADTLKPIGPVLVRGVDPLAQTIQTFVNGRLINEWSTNAMRFTPARLLARLSRYVTLFPGDVIWLGSGASSQPYVAHGDTVTVSCAGVGALTNTIVCR
jgi:2-keto-4-pentenoate hydratase/2-oxohepta-3-ene-1,7-dioic acid hydratase in catechol pathway